MLRCLLATKLCRRRYAETRPILMAQSESAWHFPESHVASIMTDAVRDQGVGSSHSAADPVVPHTEGAGACISRCDRERLCQLPNQIDHQVRRTRSESENYSSSGFSNSNVICTGVR